MKINTMKHALCAGLALCAASLANASNPVTFQVDMSTSGYDPSSQTVEVRGNFNNWGNTAGVGGFALTNNPSGPNPNLWTGTTNLPADALPAGVSVIAFKYILMPGVTYESSHNRNQTIPSTSGASLVVPPAYFNDVPPAPFTCSVTFQVDMAQQINIGTFFPNTSQVQARGLFDGWDGPPAGTALAQTNDPTILRTNQFGLVTSNVYVYTYDIDGSPGQTIDYKYYIDTGANWESPAPGTGDPNDNNNRFFTLAAETNQTVPIVYFNDAPFAPKATNAVTFQVDMTPQVLMGTFDPQAGSVEVRGNFNSWGPPNGTQILCTNDPAAPNIYKAVVPIVDGIGATEQYKFWSTVSANGGWETMANNRAFNVIDATAQVLPVVYFSNIDPNDLLPADTVVTFTVNMTNAVGTDSVAFDPSTDSVYLNGDFGSLILLTNNPVGSWLYQADVLIPKGNNVALTYTYSINLNLDEAPSGQSHVRYARTTGTYKLPLDTFGNMYNEPSFGQLAAGKASGANVAVSWLGRPGVYLQTKPSVAASGPWQNLVNTGDGTWMNGYPSANGLISVTNYPTSGGTLFFRLVKP